MTADNHSRRQRRSIRLKGYDYATPGAYFVTIVTQGRACLFGQVVEGEMRLNDAGRMAARWWGELGKKFPNSIPAVHVVMPNHFHGVMEIVEPDTDADVGADLRVCPDTDADVDVGADLRVCPGPRAGPESGAHIGAPLPGAPLPGAPLPGASLSEMIQWYKTMTTNEYIRGVKSLGWTPFAGKLWQRNYYEHIVRDDQSLQRIQRYILENPARWETDQENPLGLKSS